MVSSSGPFTLMKLAWHSFAIALASSVLPHPARHASVRRSQTQLAAAHGEGQPPAQVHNRQTGLVLVLSNPLCASPNSLVDSCITLCMPLQP
jgi:hypothetical protein